VSFKTQVTIPRICYAKLYPMLDSAILPQQNLRAEAIW